MRVVAVKFKKGTSKVYNSEDFYYKTFLDVHVGEEVIVNTVDRGLQVAMISDVDVSLLCDASAVDYIVQVIDTEPYEFYVAHDQKVATMKRKMLIKMATMQEHILQDTLMQSLQDFTNMVSAYKEELENH